MQRASTDASGRFELRVWVGHEHRIQARMPKTDSTPAGSVVETYVSVGDTSLPKASGSSSHDKDARPFVRELLHALPSKRGMGC
jgi:hypothetical protein